jgi:hypothetical protein
MFAVHASRDTWTSCDAQDLKRLDGLEHMTWDVPIHYYEPKRKAAKKKLESEKSMANGDASKDHSNSKAEDEGAVLDDILALADKPIAMAPELDRPIGGYCMDFKPRGPDSKPGQVQPCDRAIIVVSVPALSCCGHLMRAHHSASTSPLLWIVRFHCRMCTWWAPTPGRS